MSGNIVATSKNGWLSDNLEKDYLQHVTGKLSLKHRVLVRDACRVSWSLTSLFSTNMAISETKDACRCHISQNELSTVTI